jgi:RNA polymerase sigma factor (sigma-70 family)
MQDDATLLRSYVEERSETAFAELVRRHLSLVYYAALRQTGEAVLAEDVTQTVFCELARRAASLDGRPVLAGWLYTNTRFAAQHARRAEARRRQREHTAHLMNELTQDSGRAAEWETLRPVIDDALHTLEEREREAVLLRYFEGRPFEEIGTRLAWTEDATRKRVARALDKLQAVLARRGVTSTAAALGATLTGQAAMAAPAGLAASVTGVALAGTAAAGTGAGIWMTFMSMTKLQGGIIAAVAAIGATGYIVQGQTNAGLRADVATLHQQQTAIAVLQVENRRLASAAAEVELLRRDDEELKQLEQRVTEVKQAKAEQARVAQTQAQASRKKVLEEQIVARDRRTQVEVERMQREGNLLVETYKKLSAEAANTVRSDEERTLLRGEAQKKMEEIRLKQKEVQEFLKNVIHGLLPLRQELLALGGSSVVGPFTANGGTAAFSAQPNGTPSTGGTMELRLREPAAAGTAAPGEFKFSVGSNPGATPGP